MVNMFLVNLKERLEFFFLLVIAEAVIWSQYNNLLKLNT